MECGERYLVWEMGSIEARLLKPLASGAGHQHACQLLTSGLDTPLLCNSIKQNIAFDTTCVPFIMITIIPPCALDRFAKSI